MSTTPSVSTSVFPKGFQRSRQRAETLLDTILNNVFNLSRRAALIRGCVIWGIIFLVLINLAWNVDPAGWKNSILNLFTAMLVEAKFWRTALALLALIKFTVLTLITPGVARPMLVLVGPFLLAWQLTSIYLQDIFELEHTKTARKFILQAALAWRYSRIRIRNGTVDPKYEESALIQIGGPGYALVELDSAALFENVDGTPRVIGPTFHKTSHRGYAVLDGFQRLRDVIDLRDLKTDPMTNTARSRDGIPVIAKDVRMIYSVQRGKQRSSLERPHPFVEEAIQQLVHQQTAIVTPGQPSIVSREDYWAQNYRRWVNAMPGLIRDSLNFFAGEHDLSEFLANYSETELEALHRLEEENRRTSETIAPSEDSKTPPPAGEKPPAFTSRTSITSLFYDFASGFPRRAENRGVQLEWVGIGTWSTPVAEHLIDRNHLEAWRISRENYLRGHGNTLKQLRDEARIEEWQSLLHELPLATFQRTRAAGAQPEDVVKRLLFAYKEQMKEALRLYQRDKKLNPDAPEPPQKLVDAIRILNGLLSHHFSASSGEGRKG